MALYFVILTSSCLIFGYSNAQESEENKACFKKMSDRFFPDCNKDINVTAGDLSPGFCLKAWRLVECIEALASKFLREKTCEPASVQYALNMELRNVDDILKIHLQHESQCHDVTAYINSTPKVKIVELTTGGTNATIPANETNATTHPAASKVSSTSTGGPLPTVTTLPASENSSASFIGTTDTQENVTESSSQTLEDSTNGCNGISTAIEFLITLGAAAIVVTYQCLYWAGLGDRIGNIGFFGVRIGSVFWPF